MITNRRATSTDEDLRKTCSILIPTADDWEQRDGKWLEYGNAEWAGVLDVANQYTDDTYICLDSTPEEVRKMQINYSDEIFAACGMGYGYPGIWELYGDEPELKHEYDGFRAFIMAHAEEFPTFVLAFKLADATQRVIFMC